MSPPASNSTYIQKPLNHSMAPLMLERAERTGKPVYARDVIEPAIEIMDRTYTFTIDITAPLTAERRLSQAQLWAALENRRFDLFRDRLKRVAYFTVGLAAVHTVKFMVAGGRSTLRWMMAGEEEGQQQHQQ